ncbi:MAG: hypothetical protein ACJ71Z_03190 [Aeromicrobium sp.]
MACCAALTLLVSWVYRVIRLVIPGRDDEFAPAATWPPTADAPRRSALATDKPRRQQDAVGQACMVVGIAWFVAGIVAMHVLGVVTIQSTPLDLAFHSSGLWLATIGAALRFQPRHAVLSAA